jgi:hypothetical protein
MNGGEEAAVAELQRILREAAARLALDATSVTSPTRRAIVARSRDGSVLRLDVSRYSATELSI